MNTPPPTDLGKPAGDLPAATATNQRQKSALPTNRRQSLIVIEGVEDKVRPGPWKSHLALSLLAGTILWFLIQSVLLQMFDVFYVPVTTAQVEGGAIVEIPDANPPFSHLVGKVQSIAAGDPGSDPFTFPLTWVAIMSLLYGLFALTDRRQTGYAGKVLEEVPYGLKVEQEKFFASPGRLAGEVPNDATPGGKEDLDGDFFADDVPAHIRKSLGWWNATESPDSAVLANSLTELKSFLGEEAYFWLRACAIWPEPQWHLVLFLGRGLRNAHGESLHSFETADRLASLPWFMTGKMPLWLRRYFLGTLSKQEQQEIRYLVQALLVSTARGAKADFALELGEYHSLFMKTAGNETTQSILKDLPTRSPLREDLFTQFMSKPLEPAFYKSLKDRDGKSSSAAAPVSAGQSGADLARISGASRWITRLLWGACAVVFIACLVLLPVLTRFGAVTVATRHGQGVVEIVGSENSRKAPPATYYWLPAGINEISIASKDYEPVTLKVNVKGRVKADLGAVVLKHQRTGFDHPQPGDKLE